MGGGGGGAIRARWGKVELGGTRGLIIWTLLSRQLVVATTTKPNLGHLAPASEVAGRHTLPF
jgi:hypothetical protein